MHPRILLVSTYYYQQLDDLYSSDPSLAACDFTEQQQRVASATLSVADTYAEELRRLGCETWNVIVNADVMQARWACEEGVEPGGNIHDRRRRILAVQVDQFRPDVLLVFEWCPLGDAFLAEMRAPGRLLVGQISSSLRKDRTYAAYDLMVSSWPPIVERLRADGMVAEPLKLAFDRRILEQLVPQTPRFDVTFVGGFGPPHADRITWLERLLDDLDIDIFGYGVEATAQDSPIRQHHHGVVWGRRMYEVLQQSRITLNLHARIDVRGEVHTHVAANMRLYEATGVGTCLVTEQKDNLGEMFEAGCEVVAYSDNSDTIDKVRRYLAHESERLAIARAGQQRTLREHTYTKRMEHLLDLLRRRL